MRLSKGIRGNSKSVHPTIYRSFHQDPVNFCNDHGNERMVVMYCTSFFSHNGTPRLSAYGFHRKIGTHRFFFLRNTCNILIATVPIWTLKWCVVESMLC